MKLTRCEARVRAKERENLVWIQKDLWEARKFEPTDCFRVRESDS